jgi:uncharacterized protein (TIGR02421 family)
MGTVATDVVADLAAGKPARASIPGGHIDIERPLPVLILHRARPGDLATPQLLLGQSSSVVIAADTPPRELRDLLRRLVGAQSDDFGAFLLLELWAADTDDAGDELPFRVVFGDSDDVPQPAHVLRKALEPIRIGRAPAQVAVDHAEVAPPGLHQLLAHDDLRELGCLLIGLEVPAVYRAGRDGTVYPHSLHVLRRRLSSALLETFFEFIRVHTSYELTDHRELGRQTLVATGSEIDKSLAAFGAGLDYLLHITPVNTSTAFEEFTAGGYEIEPSFHYRLLPFDPDLLKRELYLLPMEDVTDPTVASLLREKRLELDRMVTLLEDRDTPRFAPGSLQVYPAVDPPLLAEADKILSRVSPTAPVDDWATPQEFAQRAEVEIDKYRALVPEMQSKVVLRDDMPGVMVSLGRLHLNASGRIARGRVEPLIQHEVGTHIVTYENGLVQPLLLLSAGLPGYEQTQEGLAMLAEYVSGGLEPNRLRLIAARVVAVDMMTHGADFVEIFRRMHRDLEITPEASWSVTMRTTRGGGSSKDAIYLRGLLDVLDHLGSGHALEPLLIGKIALAQVPLIEELLWRQILKPPRLLPRWLEMDGASERLKKVRGGAAAIDLVES